MYTVCMMTDCLSITFFFFSLCRVFFFLFWSSVLCFFLGWPRLGWFDLVFFVGVVFLLRVAFVVVVVVLVLILRGLVF